MATLNFTLSNKVDKKTGKQRIMLEFWHGRSIHQRAKTEIFVKKDEWDSESQSIEQSKAYKEIVEALEKNKSRRKITAEVKRERELLESQRDNLDKERDCLDQIISLVENSFEALDKSNVAKDWLQSLIRKFYNPTPDEPQLEDTPQSFFDVLDKYIEERDFSEQRKRHFKVVKRTLQRFGLYYDISLEFDNITPDMLGKIDKFLAEEHKLVAQKRYQKVLKDVPESRTPQPRGKNAINSFMRHLRAFIYWAIENDYTTNNPFFHKYKIVKCKYGTPVYLSKDEIIHLYNFDFSDKPRLERQRDIFIFQCMIGCRIGDLWAMTKNNIVEGAIEYIARKTKNEDPETVRVLLNHIATEILVKYKDYNMTNYISKDNPNPLLPFTSQQHYNIDIKTMFRLAGLDRIVTILNPTTRADEKHPIYEVASSHMARRCFCGNLYEQNVDVATISSMSGHTDDSRAFSRYRRIPDKKKKEAVDKLI